MGIDLGTEGCKVAIYGLDGELVIERAKSYPIYRPRIDWAEQDPMDWWRAVVECLREVLRKIRAEDVEAVSITSQREAFVPLDVEGNILTRSIIWLDRRTLRQASMVKMKLTTARILEITGLPIEHIYSALRLLWLKEEMPHVFNRIHKILFCKDFIAYKLTGEMATDYSMASRTMLLDIRKMEWSEELCEDMGIPISILPQLMNSCDVVGEVTAEASSATGLRKGIPVIIGGGDRPCEALGAGAIAEGYINIGTGTGTCFEVPLKEPRPDPKARFPMCIHVVPRTWEYEITVNATGGSLRWFRDVFCEKEVEEASRKGKSPYELMVSMATKISPGADGLFYYPYLWGARAPKFNPMAKGVFIGITHGHTKAHFIRAILEGIALQYAEVFEILEEMKVEVRRITMTGGEARSELWNIIKASVLRREIAVPRIIAATSLGAAILAAIGAKLHSSIEKATEEMVHIAKVYKPDPALSKVYQEIYKRYREIYSILEGSFRLLNPLT